MMSECLVILQCVFYSLGIINGLINTSVKNYRTKS